ncbi:MAG: hypothetical protein IJG88_03820 [Eggerthellaceae bacterium]|nr:hypothetical protein [Eggerthellaceae bacterium]
MEARRRGGVALAVALALACASPPGAAYADQLVRTYAAGEAVPSELELNGEEYSLVSWEPGGGQDAATRSFERTSQTTLSAGDYDGDPAAHFGAAMAIDEDGFSGSIPLVSATAEVSQSHPERNDYEETVEFSYITKAELDALPTTRKATVAGQSFTLSRLDVKADRVPSDPGTEIYSGSAVYGIHEGFDVADEYRLTATYAGELSRPASSGTVVAVYETASEPVASAPARESEEPGQPANESGAPWAVVVSAVIALAAGSAITAVALRLRNGGTREEAVSAIGAEGEGACDSDEAAIDEVLEGAREDASSVN